VSHPETADDNVVLAILRRCDAHAGSPAIVSTPARARATGPVEEVPRTTSITYRGLERLVLACARHLETQGVACGDVVAASLDDEIQLALCALAVLHLGATLMVIPRSTPASQREEWLSKGRARWFLTDDGHRCASAATCIRIDPARLLAAARTGDRAEVALVRRPESPALIIAGSGSTGRPKLLPVTHRQLAFRIATQNAWFGLTPERTDRVFLTSHIEYPSAAMRVLGALTSGGSVLFTDKSSTAALHHAITRGGVTVVLGTVLHVERLLAVLRPSDRPAWPALRVLGITSSTVTDDLRARIRARLTDRLYVVYGMNESMTVSVADPSMVFETPGSVGRPSPGVQVELVSAEGAAVPPGSVGLIRVRSPGQIEGYLDDAEETRRAFIDGWFQPGDLGRFTADGQLVFLGRADQMMIFNGVNIHPVEIEQCVAAHPAVRDAAALPILHPVHQDIPGCAVSLHAGMPTTEAELLRHARERMGFRGPKRIYVLDEIPRTPFGKLDRAELKRRIAVAERARTEAGESPQP
jgi:acyl-coenzyme A synthetase/AMP-(fatty) acid ligase